MESSYFLKNKQQFYALSSKFSKMAFLEELTDEKTSGVDGRKQIRALLGFHFKRGIDEEKA